MLKSLYSWICPASNLQDELQELRTISDMRLLKITSLQAECSAFQAKLDSLVHKVTESKTSASTALNTFAVTAHALHQYRDRHKAKGTDKDIYALLYKSAISHLAAMDTLPDGEYSLMKGVRGIIHNNTLVTVLPKRNADPKPRLR